MMRAVRMELQTTLRQPSGDCSSCELSLLLGLTVNHCIIAVPFEVQVGESLFRPHVERVMQEQVGYISAEIEEPCGMG
jgi:hypothetical protein